MRHQQIIAADARIRYTCIPQATHDFHEFALNCEISLRDEPICDKLSIALISRKGIARMLVISLFVADQIGPFRLHKVGLKLEIVDFGRAALLEDFDDFLECAID